VPELLVDAEACMTSEAVLGGFDLQAGYDRHVIVHGVSIEVHRGEIVCIIGPNGSGKSTLLKALYGFLRPMAGRVLLLGEDVTTLSPQERLAMGAAYVPQGRSVFPFMTVLENLELGAYLQPGRTREAVDRVFTIFPRLAERQRQQAGTMSGGEQRMLEIGRALMLDPQMLLLDEPSAGLSPAFAKTAFETVRRLNEDHGLTVLMIEQNAREGLQLADRGYVLESGNLRFSDTGQRLLENAAVRRLYLGG
jgi:ABC-type branched-subunit amino acid transport system ATPase component